MAATWISASIARTDRQEQTLPDPDHWLDDPDGVGVKPSLTDRVVPGSASSRE
jgi:hypothetical protein